MTMDAGEFREFLSSINPDALAGAYGNFSDRVLDDRETQEEYRRCLEGIGEEYPGLQGLLDVIKEHSESQGWSELESVQFNFGALLVVASLKQFAEEEELRHIIGE